MNFVLIVDLNINSNVTMYSAFKTSIHVDEK